MKNTFLTLLVSLLAGGISAYFVARYVVESGQSKVQVVTSDGNSIARTVNLTEADYPDFTYSAETAVQAVVSVKVKTRSEEYVPSGILGLFFGFGENISREQVSSGSGVIITPDGYIVTNNHVVEGASQIEVTMNDNSVHEAYLVGTDPITDVAVIKMEGDNLPTIPFADSDALRVGEWVLAIGSPYELKSTITAGIVSAKGRKMPNYTGEFKIESFIQTDAAVNPGNSGGALVDKTGALVGVNTAIFSQTGAYSGYSFAIPSNMVKEVADELMTSGKVQRAVLGVVMQEFLQKNPETVKLYGTNGVYISGVIKGSAAYAAGMREGDILLKVGDTLADDADSVREAVGSYKPGDSCVMTVLRRGEAITLDVTFTAGTSARQPGMLRDSFRRK